MQPLIVFFLKVNVIISVLFLLYWLLLRHEKFFNLNRIILLSIIASGFAMPLIPFDKNAETKNNLLYQLHEQIARMPLQPDFAAPGLASDKSEDHAPGLTGKEKEISLFDFSYVQLALMLYQLVSFAFFTRLAIQLMQVSRLLKGNDTKVADGIIYHITGKPLPPFSFFKHLVINKSQFETEQLEQIIAHEKVHIKQFHMIDILLAELVKAILWMNPFIWMLNSCIRLNLEYIADEKVLNSGINKKKYQINILTSCLNPAGYQLANLFTSSKIKLRIKMMSTENSPLSHLYKYALILPVTLATYFIINPVNAQKSTPVLKELTDKPAKEPGGIKNVLTTPSNQMIPDELQEKIIADNLIKAIDQGDEQLFKSLVAHGVNIDGAGSEGRTPLGFAVFQGKVRFVKLLLDAGADVDSRLGGEGTLLMLAVRSGNLEMVQLLLEHGANINLSSPGDGNPLIVACMYGHAQITILLVERGADVNAIVEGDETPLINASRSGNLSIAKYLVSHGANVNLSVIANPTTQPERRSPLNQAIQYEHSAVAAYLRDAGAKS